MGNKFGSATQAALDALGGAGTKAKKAAGTTAGSRYGSATTAALDALNPTAPAEQPQATNRYQNYLDMGSVVRDISGADKGAAISPQKIMEEFLRRQQNGTEPVAQLTSPENTGARIRRYEDNQQRLAALEEQAQPLYNQFRQENPTHVAGQRTALQQTAEGRALLQRMDALAQEQQQYERLYKSSDYGADARKQADFPERAAVAPHEEDAEYIAVNFDRYTPSAEKVARLKADPTYADMTEPGTGIWSEKDALYQLDDTLRSAWTLHNKSGYKHMTDEERDTYNYLYETRGKEAAHQYLQDQIIDVDKRESQKRVENFATAYDNVGGVGKAALNLATVPASVYGGIVSAAGDTVSALGGKYNPYSGSHAMTEFAQTIRGKTAEEIAAGINNETVGAFASNTYQAILSAADSVLGAATMGHGYTVAMGAGAASSRAKELYEQGAGNIQVLQGSIASGVAETLFEYVSLDKLIKTGASRTVKEWVTNILKQSFTEAGEEVSTEIANKVTDALIRGSRSDHSRAAQAYIEAGETPENARRLAWRDDVLDVLWSGYGGAVSGGLSAAAYGGVGTMQNIQEVKQIGQAYLTEGSDGKTRLGDAMEIGLSNAHGTEALETAQRIQSQLQQGKQPTAYQIGKMLLESSTPRAMRARVIEADILDSARENGVDDKTARSVAALMVRADRAARFVSPETLQTTGENGTVNQAAGSYTADGVVELASNITTDEAMDFGIKHELTHAIEGSAAYGKLKRLVQQSMGEAEYAAAVERERQSRSAKGDAQGAAGAEAEVIADWVGENLYNGDIGTGFARMIRNMDRGAAVQFQAILDGFRQTLGLTKSYRQAAALRSAERAFAEVLDSDYSSANENTAAETGDGRQYDMTIPFAEQVNRAINHMLNPRNAIYVGATSDILQRVGLNDLPMLYTQRHLANALKSKEDGGHGLTVNDILAMPEIVQHPALIMDSLTRNDSIVLVSDRLDGDGYPIIMAVRTNGTGTYDLEQIPSNFITSYYGRNDNFAGFIERAIAADKVLYINKKRSQALYRQAGLQLPYGFQRLGYDTIIHTSNNVVNTQSMQNGENNSSDGQKSYLPAELQERENAAAAEKAENARRLAEEQSEKQRQQEAQTRRQREETAGELRRQNAELRKRLERAQRETRVTTEKTVREEDVAKLTRRILREYSSTLKSDSILDAMQTLGDTIVQGEQLNYDTLHGQALDIARQIVDHSEALIDDGEGATYDGIRQYLRENKIAVSEAEKADIPDYEAWRRRNQRRLNLSKEGTPVDVIYGEMQELFGKGLLPDILNPSEQLQYLAELRDNMEPEYGNPYDSDLEQAAEACAGDILDGMLSAQVRQTSPTYADKAQAQLERQKNLAHAALEREVQRRHRALETQRNRYRDLLTRERVRTAEARVQGENAVRETKAENRQRNREAAERRKRTAEKQRVGRMLDSLEAMLAHPDKNHHIPVAATEAVRDLLATVREDPGDIQAQINELQLRLQDTSDGRQIARIRRRIAERQARLDKTTSLYEAVSKVQDRYGDIAGKTLDDKPGNPGFQHYLQEVKEMVNDRPVSDLSAAEMHELVEVMKAVHGQLKQMNTLHGKGFREGAQETGLHMAEEMAAAKGYTNTAMRNLMLWQLTPDRFFETLCGWKQDSVGAKLAAEMNEAQRTQLEILRAYGMLFDGVTNGSNAKNYERLSSTKDADMVDVGLVDSQGKPMKMTRGLMLSLYESLCCKGNRDAIVDGGMILPQLKLYYGGQTADAYVQGQALTPTALSGEIHGVLEEMKKFNTGSQEYANLQKQYMELVGRANQDLDRLKARIEGEMTDYERQLHRTVRQWFDKDSKRYINDVTSRIWNYEAARVKDYYPIYRSKDFVSTALESLVMDRTLASNGNLKPRQESKAPVLIADITQVLHRSADQTARFCGWTAFQEDFTRIYNTKSDQNSFKRALGLKWGAGKAKLGVTGDQYIQNLMADISGGRESGSSFLRFFRQNAVRATLSVNMRVAVSQAASLPTAAAEIGWKYTARAMKHLTEVNQQTMDRIADYSAYFYERRRGAGGMEEFALAKDGSNVLDKAYQSLDKATKGRLLNWCQEVDIRTVALCWFGCEEAVQDTRPELKAGSDAYYKAVGEMLDRVIIKTQPNFTVAQRSDLLRTKNEAVKFLTMYKTQANQNMNILYEVTGRLRAALQSGDKKQIQAAKKAMVNGYTAVIAGGTIAFVLLRTLVNLLQHRVKGYRDKDGEITAASMTGAIGQEVLSSMAGMFAFGDAVYDVVSARVFGERYYGVSDVALGNVSSLLEDFATGNFTSETAWSHLWRDTMNALGIPWKNLEDIAGGIIGHITDIAHGEFLSFNANSGVETTAYYRQLLHAQQNGKTEKAAKVQQFLLDSGKTPAQIQAGLRKVMQEDGDFQKREKRLLREAMESVMYRSMTEQEQKKVKSGLDGYLADTMLADSIGSRMTTAHQKAQKAIDRGVSPAAYYVGEAAKNGTTADKNGDGTVTRQEYRAMLSQSDYDQITQAVLLAQKSNTKKKKEE